MRGNRRYLKWCSNQGKGIRLTKPSENLVRAYLQKSRNSLKSMDANVKVGIVEWAVSTSYYARYFAVYALLSKVGVKCEIHDCTIALFSYLFGDSVPHQLVEELRQSKEDRIEVQYYTREVDVDLGKLMVRTKAFVLEMEKMIDGLNHERIASLQGKLREIIS